MGTVSVLYSEIKKTFPELSLDKLLIHGIILTKYCNRLRYRSSFAR